MLVGGRGDDILIGGSGDNVGTDDIVTGGAGRDLFVFNALDRTQPHGTTPVGTTGIVATATPDVITDFKAGEDRFVLEPDGRRGLGGDRATGGFQRRRLPARLTSDRRKPPPRLRRPTRSS